MKKHTKLVAGLATAMLFSLTSCSGGSGNPNAFVMMAPTNQFLGDWDNKQFFQKMKELTQTEIDFSMVYDADTYGQKLNTWYLNRDSSTYPHFFYKALLSKVQELELGSEGYFLPLESYFEECCPNLLKRMEENPMIEKIIRSYDGHIYALPTIHYAGENSNHTDGYYFINKNWCNEVGVNPDEITTIEKLRETLALFRDNGKKYPMYLSGLSEIYNIFGAFGYSILTWNAYLDDNKQVHVAAQEPKYASMMKYLREMYFGTAAEIAAGKRGVINEYFNQETSTTNKRYYLQRGEVGCFIDYSTEVAGDYANQYVALPALNSSLYTGEAFWPGRIGVDSGAFAITKRCTDPKPILKWIDKVYDVDISRWDTIGVENIDWKYDDDTKTTWSFIGDREEISAKKCVQYGGGLPGVEMSYDYFYSKCSDETISHSYQEIAKAQAKIKPGVPQVSVSLEYLKTLNRTSGIISEKVGNFILKSITQKDYDVDSQWNALQTDLTKGGVDDYVTVLQDAVNNFYK